MSKMADEKMDVDDVSVVPKDSKDKKTEKSVKKSYELPWCVYVLKFSPSFWVASYLFLCVF